jgi:hypothetical protein
MLEMKERLRAFLYFAPSSGGDITEYGLRRHNFLWHISRYFRRHLVEEEVKTERRKADLHLEVL